MWVNSVATKEYSIAAPLVAPVVLLLNDMNIILTFVNVYQLTRLYRHFRWVSYISELKAKRNIALSIR